MQAFTNKTKGRSRAGAHIFLSEDDPFPRWNGAILTIAQVIKFVMTSAAKAELGALFIAAQKLVPLHQTLIEMGWTHPPTPIQTDNTTAAGVVNKTLLSNKLKSMDLRFHWLRCSHPRISSAFIGTNAPIIGGITAQNTIPQFTTSPSITYLRAQSLSSAMPSFSGSVSSLTEILKIIIYLFIMSGLFYRSSRGVL